MDYACTLLAAIVGPESAAFIQIGDGAIVVPSNDPGGWAWINWPQHGEYANSTNFVQSPNLPEVLCFEMRPDKVDELAIFSDGIENLVLQFSNKTVHGPFFDQMMKPVRLSRDPGLNSRLSDGLSAYLGSKAICEKTDDDKTLVLASRCHAF